MQNSCQIFELVILNLKLLIVNLKTRVLGVFRVFFTYKQVFGDFNNEINAEN